MLSGSSSSQIPNGAAPLLKFCMYQTAGRANFVRFLSAIAKVQKKIVARFFQNGVLEFTQQPDVSNKIAHFWINSNREVFGLDDYSLVPTSMILELPLRPLVSIMRASDGLETLRFEYVERSGEAGSKLVISAGSEFITFTSTVHELPVKRFSPLQSDSLFREPLINKPSITFIIPSITTLQEKLTRLTKQAVSATVAANHDGKFEVTVTGTMTHAKLAHDNLQIIRAVGDAIADSQELLSICVSLESLVRTLGCVSTIQGQVLVAIVPGQSIIFSTKIANPCGSDRPSGSVSLILGAFEAN